MRLYLASTSPARRSLLAQSGIEPVLVAPGVDEDAAAADAEATLGRALSGPELVSLLALAKAHAVADRSVAGHPVDGLVFGGDSAFEVAGRLYGKPHDPAVARARWREMLAAGSGVLWSGHCVVDRRRDRVAPNGAEVRVPPAAPSSSGRELRCGPLLGADGLEVRGDHVVAVDSARLTFAEDMDPDEIDAYVATDEPLEVAGAFTIDGRAAAYISRIDGAPSAVVGLSLPMLRRMLRVGFDVTWHDLWSTL
ncbi:Maf family protein [Curtobacterium ammoniigenes]|uniref:Maf family protein n=1 Tax=Curtobacterium ammoniigenes TaxID=395387 RepID=UPI00082B02F6|nr:Maf family protein [Curtobacterium ammoniigenes]